jgi:inorganic pyrophosphatase
MNIRLSCCRFELSCVRILFPYGFILGTCSGDGMGLDCFLLTRSLLRSGKVVDADPIGMFEQIEDGQEDHNILAIPIGEWFDMTANIQDALRDFVVNVFADIPGKRITVGRFLGKDAALSLIDASVSSQMRGRDKNGSYTG